MCSTLLIVFVISLTMFSICSGWSVDNHITCSSRRNFIQNINDLVPASIIVQTVSSNSAHAANLPTSNGADLSKTGTIEKLIPIVTLDKSLKYVQSILTQQSQQQQGQCSAIPQTYLKSVIESKQLPATETEFKRMFDEYSDPVSYKQKYLDQNAFLVYYTQGFDGPNRPSIESDVPRQTLQYGARNDAWTSFDDFMVEMKFAMTNNQSCDLNDIIDPLNKTISALQRYIELAPKDDVDTVEQMLNKKG